MDMSVIVDPCLREIKNQISCDTVGAELGSSILTRARRSCVEVPTINEDAFNLDAVADPWWTSQTDSDNMKEVDIRVRNFLWNIRFQNARIIIVVGHSLFFRRLFKNYSRKEAFGKRKMDNNACVRCEIDFNYEFPIQSADFVFDTNFKS